MEPGRPAVARSRRRAALLERALASDDWNRTEPRLRRFQIVTHLQWHG